jgi:hypothetical protein
MAIGGGELDEGIPPEGLRSRYTWGDTILVQLERCSMMLAWEA